jgi:hypothetical protein
MAMTSKDVFSNSYIGKIFTHIRIERSPIYNLLSKLQETDHPPGTEGGSVCADSGAIALRYGDGGGRSGGIRDV